MTQLFSFGIISDVQYADIDNRYNYSHTRLRYYRNAKNTLHKAVEKWVNDDRDIPFIIQLGDVIDGFNTEGGKQESMRVLKEIVNEFGRYPGKIHHLIGNHELYNFTRKELYESKLFSAKEFLVPEGYIDNAKNGDSRNIFYYHFSPYLGYRFVIIDSYDVSMLGWGKESTVTCEAKKIVTSVNHNKELNSPFGLHGLDVRFVKFNGAVGDRQRKWLKYVLQSAEDNKEKVFIFGHIPFHPSKTGDKVCLLWDYDQVLDILYQFKCVVATFAGHTHTTDYTLDANGIHHVVIPAVVETPPGVNAFGTIDVYKDKFVLNGYGTVNSGVFQY